MTADLGDFLRRAGHRAREAGTWDCCAMPAAWAIENGFPDPMAAWRGAYSTEADGEHIVAAAGSLAELFARGMGDAGVPEAQAPYRAGDIGVVELLDEQAGAVYTGKRWALVADRGIGVASVEAENIVRAWRVDNG